jgi:hypothetical protein
VGQKGRGKVAEKARPPILLPKRPAEVAARLENDPKGFLAAHEPITCVRESSGLPELPNAGRHARVKNLPVLNSHVKHLRLNLDRFWTIDDRRSRPAQPDLLA